MIRILLHLERDRFDLSFYDRGWMKSTPIQESDKKLVQAELWQHFPAIRECKTHTAALKVLTDLEKYQQAHDSFAFPVILAYDFTTENKKTISTYNSAGFDKMKKLVQEKIDAAASVVK